MGFFSTLVKAVKAPAKQSAKTTSVANVAKGAVNGLISGAAGAVKAAASVVKGASEVAKKKAAAEAAAKSKAAASARDAAQKASQSNKAKITTTANKVNILLEWKGHKFYVTPTKVIGFKGLQITSNTATEDEENGGCKYVKKKNDGGYEVKFTAIFDQRLGVSDVRSAAMKLAEDARTGASGYVYNNGSKLFTPNMMGTGATVKNIVIAPNGTWISCEVDLTLKQCGKGDGSSGGSGSGGGGGGGGGGGYKYSVTVYYSGSSGAIQSVIGYSNKSKEDARKKAWAKVPGNAQWASETKSQATNQTTNAKNTAKDTVKNAKDASKYVNDKINSVKKPATGGAASKITPAKQSKPVAVLR